MRRDLRDMWIGSLLLTLAISLPLFFSDSDYITQKVISLIVGLIIIWYFGTRLSKAGAFRKENQEINKKHLLILLPLCVSFLGLPFLMLLNIDGIVIFEVNEYFFLDFLNALLIAISEEMFFRMIIYNMLKTKSRLLKILASAGICALFEIIVFFQTFSILVTIVNMVKGFVLGIFLGFLREYTESIYPCMVFHFVYLFFTETIVNLCYVVCDAGLMLAFTYGMPILALVYCGLIYICYFKNKELDRDVF